MIRKYGEFLNNRNFALGRNFKGKSHKVLRLHNDMEDDSLVQVQ